MRYIAELEHKVQILQTEATTLSAQLTHLQVHPPDHHPSVRVLCRQCSWPPVTRRSTVFMALKSSSSSSSLLQRDSSGLATHNNELKFRLQAMEQQAQLRDGEQPSN